MTDMKKYGKWLLVPLMLVWFLLGISRMERGGQAEELRLLEDALRRGAAACYAAEGFYPPELTYLCRHYGVIIDESRYVVYYDAFASNLMPDITVLKK